MIIGQSPAKGAAHRDCPHPDSPTGLPTRPGTPRALFPVRMAAPAASAAPRGRPRQSARRDTPSPAAPHRNPAHPGSARRRTTPGRAARPRASAPMEGWSLTLKIAPISVQSQIVARLREAICDGTLRPGEKLSEPALCRDLGVSRTSIREALRSLAAEKLVTIVPNRGPSVTRILWPEADALYRARALLEAEAVALLAGNVQQPQVRDMAAALMAFETAAWQNDTKAAATAATRFHAIIQAGCGNPVIGELLQALHTRIGFLRVATLAIPGRPLASLREMRAMLDAMATGNPPLARQAAIDHVNAASAAAASVYDKA
jgi:DNA-binding GntR family transcriptional regulator